MARLPLGPSLAPLALVCLIVVQGCSRDRSDVLPTAPQTSERGVALEDLARAYGQVDAQQALVLQVADQWQNTSQDELARLGWSYDAENAMWVEENVSHSGEYWSRDGEFSEVRHELSHRIEVALTQNGRPQSDFVTADHMTVYHVIRSRYFALNRDFPIKNPYDYSSVGGYDVVLRRGHVLSVVGQGTVGGWEAHESDGEDQDFNYDGEFSVDIRFASASTACPAAKLESVITITNSFGDILDRYWSAATADPDDASVERLVTSEFGHDHQVVDQKRSCAETP